MKNAILYKKFCRTIEWISWNLYAYVYVCDIGRLYWEFVHHSYVSFWVGETRPKYLLSYAKSNTVVNHWFSFEE